MDNNKLFHYVFMVFGGVTVLLALKFLARGEFALTEQRTSYSAGMVLGTLSSSHGAFYPLVILLLVSGLALTVCGVLALKAGRSSPSPLGTTTLLLFFLVWGALGLTAYLS